MIDRPVPTNSVSWTPSVTVATVVERDGQFLMVEECIDGELVYNQPAGHLEDKESLLEAAIRETLEETAWEVRPEAIIGIYQWRHTGNGKTFLRFCFAASAIRHHPGRPLDTEIQQAIWLNREEITASERQLRTPLVLKAIDDYRQGRRYPLEVLNWL